MVGAFVELRAELLLEALREVIDKLGKPGELFAEVDFQNVGLMGHSRGGEAVVRSYDLQKAKAVPGVKIRAVCSLSPTDFRGSTNAHKLAMPAEPDSNLLVVYGDMDGDVSGVRIANRIDRGGTGFRLYDRSPAKKAMATIRNAMHNRFNEKWPDSAEWPVVPASVIGRPEHQALAQEYIGGFFDLILNGNAKQQALFRNEVQSKSKLPIALQWQIGSQEKPIDTFSVGGPETGARPAVVGGSDVRFAPLTPPAGSPDPSIAMRVPHDDHVYRIDKAAVGGATHTLTYDLGSENVSLFEALTFRLGQLYPIVDQAAIDALAPPVFKLLLEDTLGVVATITSATIYANQKNGWVKPSKKTIGAAESTLMYLQTLQVTRKQLDDGAKPKKIDLAQLKSIKFEFDTGAAAAAEIWLDSILFVRN
jgi:hypothetical protein